MAMMRRDGRYGTILGVILRPKGTMDILRIDLTAVSKELQVFGVHIRQTVTVSTLWLNVVVIVRLIQGV